MPEIGKLSLESVPGFLVAFEVCAESQVKLFKYNDQHVAQTVGTTAVKGVQKNMATHFLVCDYVCLARIYLKRMYSYLKIGNTAYETG